MRKNRSSLLFASCLAIAGILLVQMAMYVLHVMLGFQLRFNLFEVCTIWLESLGFDSLIYPMNGLVFYTLAGAAALTFRQLWLSRSMARKLASLRDDRLTEELNRRYPEGQADLTVIAHREPMAFTMGFVAPRIVLSTGLLELLDERETEAVIHHERFHKRHRDPLRMYVLSLLAALMWRRRRQYREVFRKRRNSGSRYHGDDRSGGGARGRHFYAGRAWNAHHFRHICRYYAGGHLHCEAAERICRRL